MFSKLHFCFWWIIFIFYSLFWTMFIQAKMIVVNLSSVTLLQQTKIFTFFSSAFCFRSLSVFIRRCFSLLKFYEYLYVADSWKTNTNCFKQNWKKDLKLVENRMHFLKELDKFNFWYQFKQKIYLFIRCPYIKRITCKNSINLNTKN